MANRKLVKTLCSKITHDIPVSTGDLFDVFVRTDGHNGGKRYLIRSVSSFYRSPWTVPVPTSNGVTMSAAIEYVRQSIPNDLCDALIWHANHTFDRELGEICDEHNESSTVVHDVHATHAPATPFDAIF